MAVTTKPLIVPKEMLAASTSQYAAPSNGYAIIDKFTVTNHLAGSATINVWIVAGGDVPSDSNLIANSFTLAEDDEEDISVLVGHVLNPLTEIYTSGTGSALTIYCSGREIIP